MVHSKYGEMVCPRCGQVIEFDGQGGAISQSVNCFWEGHNLDDAISKEEWRRIETFDRTGRMESNGND